MSIGKAFAFLAVGGLNPNTSSSEFLEAFGLIPEGDVPNGARGDKPEEGEKVEVAPSHIQKGYEF